MTDGDILRKIERGITIGTFKELKEKTQGLKNRGFLKRETNCWRVTEAGRAYIRTH